MSVMSDQKKLNEKIRKQIYRAKQREQLGDEEYKKQQAQKKREYRAKKKTNNTPNEQQQVIKNVVEKVIQNVTPQIVKQETTETKGKITSFFKPITKEQYLKNIQNEPVKTLINEIKTTLKKDNEKPKNIISDNINDEIEKIMNEGLGI